MAPPEPHRRRLVGAWLAVLLLHALLGLVLIQSVPSRRVDGSAKPPARLTVRLLPPAPIEPVPADRQPVAQRPARDVPARGTTTMRASTKVLSAPASISPPMLSAAPEAPSPAAAAAEPSASAPPRPLDLAVRPRRLEPDVRSQALSDPRANSRTTPEMRMAQTLGDGRVTEENLGDGRRRFRQSGKCVQSQPTRASQLDPFGHAAMPNLIGEC